MADMFDCGAYTYKIWKEEKPYITRWLGPFNPNMPKEELDRRLEHEKLTENAVVHFWLGFESAKKKDK